MRKSIPDFKTEQEELVFWETHRIEDYDDGPVDIIWDIRTPRKKRATMRIEAAIVARLKGFASGHDTRYQTLARGLTTRGKRRFEEAR